MNNLTKQDVINIIKEFNTTQGGTVGGFTVPKHQHNGSDSLKVLMGDLQSDIRGLQFSTLNGIININSQILNSTQSLLTIDNQDKSGNDNQITLSPTTTSFRIRNTLNNNANYIFADDSIQITSALPWWFHYPVNLALPPTPVIGDTCFYSSDGGITGQLQVCESAGVWTAK